MLSIGNEWSREYFDGPFYLWRAALDRPAISLVFVQSRDGNTVADNPSQLGGGPTDLHLIYEGLSRVAADAVMAGASTVGQASFFTVHHPEMIALRAELGLPRHPTQIVMSHSGNIDLSARLFNVPDVPVFILAGPGCVAAVAPQLHDRPWISMLPIRDALPDVFVELRDRGVGRISAVGGPTVATALVDAGLVQDLYLTTSPIDAGQSGTPWYVGAEAPELDLIVRKRERDTPAPILFEHFALRR